MTLRFSFLTSLAALLFSLPAFANDYLPNTVGNTWTYDSGSSSKTVEIIRSSGNWRGYDGFAGLGPQYRTDISNCGPETFTIGAKNQTLRTPAGTFNDVLRLDVASQCRDAGTTAIWFAPDVGVIRWEELTIVGPVRYTFTSGTVEGIDYPIQRPAPLTITFAPDRDSIWLNLMPAIGGPRQHDTSVTTRLTVANTGDRQIDLQYRSGQRFDIVVEDDNGNVVAQWAANKRFTSATATVAVKPGEEVSYEGTVRLPEKEGTYTVRMASAAHNRRIAAETSVEVVAVY